MISILTDNLLRLPDFQYFIVTVQNLNAAHGDRHACAGYAAQGASHQLLRPESLYHLSPKTFKMGPDAEKQGMI